MRLRSSKLLTPLRIASAPFFVMPPSSPIASEPRRPSDTIIRSAFPYAERSKCSASGNEVRHLRAESARRVDAESGTLAVRASQRSLIIIASSALRKGLGLGPCGRRPRPGCNTLKANGRQVRREVLSRIRVFPRDSTPANLSRYKEQMTRCPAEGPRAQNAQRVRKPKCRPCFSAITESNRFQTRRH